MRWNGWAVFAALALGCDDGKDTGADSGAGGAGSGRSIDLGGCSESGLAGADSLPLQVVTVPAGSWLMGDDAEPDASPSHDVTLTRDFEITVTEITQGQWMGAGVPNPSQHSECAACPVEQVTWHEAAAFADTLSASEGLATCYDCSGSGADTSCTAPADPYSCEGWRLPTEAEWEYAAGLDSTTFAGSDDFAEVAWTAEAVGRPCPVGSLKPTSLGLYDLSGNVSEWVHDGHADYPSDAVTDPVGEDSSESRGVRGGSVFEVSDRARVTARSSGLASEVVPWRGLRLVRSL